MSVALHKTISFYPEIEEDFYADWALPQKVKLSILDWEEEFKRDMESGRGFVISNPEPFGKNDVRNEDGIYSPIYGTDWSDENPFVERYSCKCKKMQGGLYEGLMCPHCKTKVKFVDRDIFTTGWVVFDKYYIIHPTMYNMLASFLGAKTFLSIIKFSRKKNRDGKYLDNDIKNTNPYEGIGMIEFMNKFEEIMGFFLKKNRNRKVEVYNFVMENIDKVFVNKIPLYSVFLRPIMKINDDFVYANINKKYRLLVTQACQLNDSGFSFDTKPIRVLPVLYEMQELLDKCYEIVIEGLSTKQGHIRKYMLGNRVNFSARCVIVPSPKLKNDEIELPYLGVLELYRPDIINLLTKFEGLTVDEAQIRWFLAKSHFDPKIYEIMMYIIKNTKGGARVLINRNPSLVYGSILVMKIAGIKKDYDDLTMSVPLNILGILNADFDGDVLNIIRLVYNELADVLEEVFNPKLNMFIDRNDGYMSSRFLPFKDIILGVWGFNNL